MAIGVDVLGARLAAAVVIHGKALAVFMFSSHAGSARQGVRKRDDPGGGWAKSKLMAGNPLL